MKNITRFPGYPVVLLSILMLLISSCGGSSDNEAANDGTGSITFSLHFPDSAASSPASALSRYKAMTIDCALLGIESVEALVYDGNDVLIGHGGPWPCSLGEGIIYGIKAGTHRKIVILLKGSGSTVRFKGERSDITVIAGRTTVLDDIDLIEMEEVNEPPIASNDSMTVNQGETVSALDNGDTSLLDNDIDPERGPLTIDTEPVSGPAHGTIVINPDGTFLYSHRGHDTLPDSFTYRVSDSEGGTDTATAAITIVPWKNTGPVLSDGRVTPEQGSTLTGFRYTVRYTDADGHLPASITVTIDGTETGMRFVSESEGSRLYEHVAFLEQGDDHRYSFSCSDGHGGEHALPVAAGPVVADDAVVIASDDAATVGMKGVVTILDTGKTSVLGNDTAADGSALKAALVTDPAYGRVELNEDGTFSYRHEGPGTDPDSFTYRAWTDRGEHTATVTVTVRVTDSDPSLSEPHVSPEGGDISTLFVFTVKYFDPDGDLPSIVQATIGAQDYRMEPVPGTDSGGVYRCEVGLPAGIHSYRFSCSDGHGGYAYLPDSESWCGEVEVLPANIPPDASDDHLIVIRGQSASKLSTGHTSVLDNDTDPEGDKLTAMLQSGPSHGTVELNSDGTFIYTHNADDPGTDDSFVYLASDGLEGGVDTAVVRVSILPGGGALPVLTRPEVDPLRGDGADTFTFRVRYFDEDGQGPLVRHIFIDGEPCDMTLSSGLPYDGTYTFEISGLPEGEHGYFFSFTDDSGNECVNPSSGSIPGPAVFRLKDRYHVSPNGSDDNSGSAALPFATIGRAIEEAGRSSADAVLILIAGGTYSEHISLPARVCLQGGWNADFTLRWSFRDQGMYPTVQLETVIDGKGSGRCVTMSGAHGAGMDGITIRNGTSPSNDPWGGGVLIYGCSPDIRYCHIENNTISTGAKGYGAGMYISGECSPVIAHCVFWNNRADGSEYCRGGALYTYGSSPLVTGCTFSGNHAESATGAGGAIYSHAGSPVIEGCLFSGNGAAGVYAMGGAVYSTASSPVITGCVFMENTATGTSYAKGGALYATGGNPVVTNCTFTLNTASCEGGYAKGGAMYSTSAAMTITNCILWQDTALYYGKPTYTEIYHDASCTITFSNIGQTGFEHDTKRSNINAYPVFTDPDRFDFRLRQGSPCIDAGSPDAPFLPESDFDGRPRIIGASADMGAFEW